MSFLFDDSHLNMVLQVRPKRPFGALVGCKCLAVVKAVWALQGAVDAAQAFICDLFPAVIATVRNEDEEVRLAPVPFLQSYANKLKASLKRISVLPEVPPPPLPPPYFFPFRCPSLLQDLNRPHRSEFSSYQRLKLSALPRRSLPSSNSPMSDPLPAMTHELNRPQVMHYFRTGHSPPPTPILA